MKQVMVSIGELAARGTAFAARTMRQRQPVARPRVQCAGVRMRWHG